MDIQIRQYHDYNQEETPRYKHTLHLWQTRLKEEGMGPTGYSNILLLSSHVSTIIAYYCCDHAQNDMPQIQQ